jgi:DNA-binding CsgD family transcriptional regulator
VGEVPLIEREHERGALAAALASACAGRGGLLAFEGRAGLGKSKLIDLARDEATGSGHLVLRATGSELERQFPFGAALQLLEPALATGRVDQREALLAGAAGLARPLFDRGLRTEGEGEDRTFSLLHGLYWLVSNLAEERPLLLTVDDAQWVDRPTLRFLLYLAQRLDGLPVAVVLALRSSEPRTPRDLLDPLLAHPAARVLRLEPLSAEGVGRAIRARMPEAAQAFCDACTAVSGGNPFLLSELLLALRDEGIEPVAEAAPRVWRVAPEAVLRSMLARLAQLPGAAFALARAAAVLGDDAELRHAAALAGVALDEAPKALDALAAAEILSPRHPLAFEHPLLHSTIYADMPRAERASAHAQAARLLAGQGGALERVAAHLLESWPSGDPWTVSTLREAARRASVDGAPQSSGLFLRRALEEPPSPDVRVELLVELGKAEAASGEASAFARFASALELSEQPQRRGEIYLALGDALISAGRESEATEAFDRGAADLDGVDERLATRLEAAWLSAARHLPELRARAAERLQPILERSGATDTYEERWLIANVAHERAFAGEPYEETVALAKRALGEERLQLGSDPEGVGPMIAVSPLAWADDFDTYERVVHGALADSQRRGSIADFANASFAMSFTRFFRGRIADAVADAQQAVDCEGDGWGEYSPAARTQLAWALIERDELAAAERALEVPGLETQWAGSAMYALVADARGRIALARGDARRALECSEQVAAIGLALGFQNPACLPWRSNMALAASALGDSGRALDLCEQELSLARRFGAGRGIGVALRALGLVAAPDRGIDHLREAVSVLSTSPAALEHCRALIDLGATLRSGAHSREARESLREGLGLARGFGALALERRAEEELKAAGARPRRRELSGVGSLTPSERRVAGMAAEGMSNREIAQALFVTNKAVEWHLGNSYRKLEITGREQLAEALREPPGAPEGQP